MDIVRDELGPWSINKLEIVQKYANAYGKIINGFRLHPIYIDGFAGCGHNVERATGEPVEGSPLRVLDIEPGFEEYHFIDVDGDKLDELKVAAKSHSNVFFYNEDANKALLRIIPTVKYSEFKRALCVLDPYGPRFGLEGARCSRQTAHRGDLLQLLHHGHQPEYPAP